MATLPNQVPITVTSHRYLEPALAVPIDGPSNADQSTAKVKRRHEDRDAGPENGRYRKEVSPPYPSGIGEEPECRRELLGFGLAKRTSGE